jgi:hypothetical protein
MKFTKMSLVAALLVGSSSFALENVKVSGDAKLYYETVGNSTKAGIASTNAGGAAIAATTTQTSNDFGDRKASNAQAAIDLSITADLVKNVSAGVSLAVTDTLGLENNLVGGTWAGPLANANLGRGGESTGATGSANANTTQWWISEAWLATTVDKTTAKVGRQFLDTPLAFTETWTIAKNSFSAAVLINQDLPDTTLVAAYVGQSNGAASGQTVAAAGNSATPFTGYSTFNNSLGVLNTAITSAGGLGAYGYGVVNNTIKPLVAQFWFYDVPETVQAFWLQGDVKVDNVMLGAQYAVLNPEDKLRVNSTNTATSTNIAAHGLKDSKAYAVMAGIELKDIATIKAAYSKTDDKGFLNVQNTATGNQSKLYTEAWWNYGYVGMPGARTYMVAAEGELKDMFTWFAQYTNIAVRPDNGIVKDVATNNFGEDKIAEIAMGVSKSFGPLDTTLAYISTDVDKGNTTIRNSWVAGLNSNTGDYSDNRLQAYLTLNF